MKKFRKTAVAALVLTVLCVLAAFVAACGDKITGISVENSGLPQTIIQGNDLDLSGYKLTVNYDGKTEEIALDAEGVVVSGFDKNTVGEQTVTVTYMEMTTSFKITVVRQMVAENYLQQYFLNEEFNVNRGRLRYGDNKTVNFSDESVTISGFDSSSVGEKTVNISCKIDDNTTYTTSIKVTVYAIDDATISAPNKIAYNSHETELNVSGGYLTLINRAVDLRRNVQITPEMCTGFDPSAATVDNLKNSLPQTVTVNYQNVTKQFTIRISFSGVSLMQLRASEIKQLNLNWKGDKAPAFEEAVGVKAVEAMQSYVALNSVDKELVSDEDRLCVARVAAVHGLTLWNNAADEYKDTFSFVGGDAHFNYDANVTRQKAEENYAKLEDPNADIRVYGELIGYIYEEFRNETLFGEKKFYQYFEGVPDVSSSDNVYNNVLSALEFAFDVADRKLNGVDANWNDSTAQKEKIKTAIKYIYDSDFYGGDQRNVSDLSLCKAIGRWLGFEDLADTFVQYSFLNDDVDSINNVKFLWLPGDYEEFIEEIMTCLETVSAIVNPSFISLVLDTSDFMLSYGKLEEMNEAISKSTDELDKWLYKSLNFVMQFDETTSIKFSLPEYVQFVTTSGYDIVHGAFLGDDEYFAVWDMLIDLLKAVGGNSIINTDFTGELGEKVDAMFKAFANLSPAQQYGIIVSINPMYETSKFPAYALDYVTYGGGMTAFTQFISTYYTKQLSEDASNVFAFMLMAMEDYARIFEANSDGMADYFSSYIINMTLAYSSYQALVEDKPEEAAVFDRLLGDVYQTMFSVYSTYDIKYELDDEGNLVSFNAVQKEQNEDGTAIFPLGDWDEDFKALAYYALRAWIYGQQGIYEGAIAAYERADRLAQQILSSGDKAIINAYRYLEFDLSKATLNGESLLDGSSKVVTTVDQLMRYARTFYVGGLTQGYTTSLWADYQKLPNLKQFMFDSYDLFDLAYKDINEYEYTAADRKIVEDSVKAFRELSVEERSLYMSINVDSGNSYYISLAVYINATLGVIVDDEVEPTAASDYASQVIFFEAACTAYEIAAEENKEYALKNIQKQYKEVKEAQAALSDEDKAIFAGDFKFIEDMLKYYEGEYAALLNA